MNQPLHLPFGLKPVSEELLKTFHQLNSEQLQWLSGYCAGVASVRGSNFLEPEQSTPSELDTASRLKTLILYGSQTGNSEGLAKQLYSKLETHAIDLEIDCLENIKVKDLAKKDAILLVVSTHGEGEPPDDAIDFFDVLNSKRAPDLKGINHAVLALGDSSYEFFCQTGKDFDNRLTELGSNRLLDRCDCDLEHEQQASQWIESLNKCINEMSSARNPSMDSNSNQVRLGAINLVEENNQTFTKANPLTAKVMTNQKITGKGSSKKVHHIELSLEEKNFSYLPGDSVGIWIKNNESLVAEILALLGFSGEEPIKIKNDELILKSALTERLEITLLNKSTIQKVVDLVRISDISAAVNLEKTTDGQSFIQSNQLIDLLFLTNAAVNLKPQQLVDLLLPIKPRVYSIASSLEANQDELHITVGLKENENERGLRTGAASQLLIETLREDDEVLIYLEPNKRFRLPDENKPIILVGPGTGIAPFRSFLQERVEQKASGKNWLFFGERNFNTDFLYQTEWQKLFEQGLLSKLDVAFSRDQKEKNYVQNKLEDNAKEIWQWINEEDACFYVCGDMKRMAKDVESSLLSIITEQGSKTSEQAKNYLKQLKKDSRYQRDVY